uniref:Ovule protein n=1 Tax=Panagrellus redivivus TaxID=6233 RepID=A0A7E4VAU2_PANRE
MFLSENTQFSRSQLGLFHHPVQLQRDSAVARPKIVQKCGISLFTRLCPYNFCKASRVRQTCKLDASKPK